MELKEMLLREFGVDPRISGGWGDSIDTPIILHNSAGSSDYVGTAYYIVKCILSNRGLHGEPVGQELLIRNGRNIDKIMVGVPEVTSSGTGTRIEELYFDITEHSGDRWKENEDFNEEETLARIVERMKTLERLSEFNGKCIDLLREGRLQNDNGLTIEFLDVLFKDESLHLFEKMYDNKRKPILHVLRDISARL
ncbi:MAG: hypothetical protein KF797_06820 [Flavobacteriales bacterium]|nr:hypothetical protein [Flavobacteriales bacterium]